jgi:hypothetical protein
VVAELARVVQAKAAAASISRLSVWAGGGRQPSRRGKRRQCASVGWAQGGQEGHSGGWASCPDRRISSPNLRPKSMHVDVFRHRYQFRLSRWIDSFIHTDAFKRAMSD